MINHFGNIPLPQDTRMYTVIDGKISEPRYFIDDLLGECEYPNYSNFTNTSYLFQFYNQNISEVFVRFLDKSTNSIAGQNSYFDINGFDYGFEYRFINKSSPTVCFLPSIKSSDNGSNIDISFGSINVNNLSFENVDINDYILLTNQSISSENVLYRITAKTGDIITLYSDSDINNILTQNQNAIFTRAKVRNDNGTYYYGLYNTTNFYWASQEKGLELPKCNYGVTLNSEMTSDRIDLSYFTVFDIIPKVGENVAINVSVGGRTSGVYVITKVASGFVYISPIYPPYIFVHQFVKIDLDLSTSSNSVWFVDPSYLGGTTYIYTSKSFAFKTYDPSGILSNPSNWAKQVGGKNDEIIGFTLYSELENNNFISNSDIFSFTIKTPDWVDDGASVKGISLNTYYETNMVPVREEAVVE
jgi:hypothetical protein